MEMENPPEGNHGQILGRRRKRTERGGGDERGREKGVRGVRGHGHGHGHGPGGGGGGMGKPRTRRQTEMKETAPPPSFPISWFSPASVLKSRGSK